MFRKRIVYIGLLLMVWQLSPAFSEGYSIDLFVKKSTPETVYYLGEYNGYQQTIIDTAEVVKPGNYRFSSATRQLPVGIYFITQNKTRIDFIIEQSANFAIEVSDSDLTSTLAFKNSEENTLYKNVSDELSPWLLELTRLDSILKAKSSSSPEYEVFLEQSTQCLEKVNTIKNTFVKKHPQHLLSLIFETQRDIDVPLSPEGLGKEASEEWRYRYYRAHYFDYFDFSDFRLGRTPVFYVKIEQYLNQIVPTPADSVINALSLLLEKAEQNKSNFRSLMDYIMIKYEQSDIVGHDAVWVFLVENYYLKGSVNWVSQATLASYAGRLKKVKPWLIGQIPPEMWYPDSSNNRDFQKMTSLFSATTPYTVILFWEPECPYCKREIIKLKEHYKRKKELGFEVITVARDPNIERMKKMIRELELPFINLYGGGGPAVRKRDDIWPIDGIPTTYVLDKDKRIVVKKISVDYIEQAIKNNKK